MPKIAISYRRSDSTAIAGRILDRLVANYGAHSVFMDVHSIPYGTDFRAYIQKALADVDVVLAVIGPHWLGQPDSNPDRISDSDDLVRIEVETALNRGILVIPILVSGAAMLSATQLPDTLKQLANRNAAVVDGGRDFHHHVDRLISTIDEAFPDAAGPILGDHRSSKAAVPVAAQTHQHTPWMSTIRDILVALACILLAHYIIVVALDIHALYARLSSVVVPLVCAVVLYRNARPNVARAVFCSACIGIIAVVLMALMISVSFGQSFLPATRYEWRESAEYVVSIGVAFFVGFLLAPSISRLRESRV